MRTSQSGIDLIKRHEGLEVTAYQDIAGVWTIGYGHTGRITVHGSRFETVAKAVEAFGVFTISEREVDRLLAAALRPREAAVSRLVTVGLNQNEFDALVSFVYNVGIAAFARSTARKRLNRGDRAGAAEALTWWNKATVDGVLRAVTGLIRRRADEHDLFMTPMPRPEDEPKGPVGDEVVDEPGITPEPEETEKKKEHPFLAFLRRLFRW